ncbi:LOG family protein [Alcanivorax sediminis]|uniref:Cytokinin riboside 5'-monophosphate phosphoribohydrolase n=1 Tax=Alcanivorax sediminis TaxID=2663008 RepID=A0A6N7LPU5_9GAMM|nr:TIGR00730 family Rossman fold protein [Alcanivorax sediminis]MQX52063.1 TIGR00730 family Rossman fold protein [Alcanivorax sediminis]
MKKICVYCGSSSGKGDAYLAAADKLADALVSRGLELVYGGASIGIMGALASAVMERGGSVIGIMPQALMRREIGNDHLTELQVVDSMHERKAAMADQSDGFIALPGGMGTFEELFEILTWAQLGFHNKPVGLLNIDGYYDHLIQFLDHTVEQGLLRQQHRDLLRVQQDPETLLDNFLSEPAPLLDIWIERTSQL